MHLSRLDPLSIFSLNVFLQLFFLLAYRQLNQLCYLLLLLFFFIQVLHILTGNLQSPGTISFSVPGNQPAKICSKVN